MTAGRRCVVKSLRTCFVGNKDANIMSDISAPLSVAKENLQADECIPLILFLMLEDDGSAKSHYMHENNLPRLC